VKPRFRKPAFRATTTGFSNRRFSSTFAPPLTASGVINQRHCVNQGDRLDSVFLEQMVMKLVKYVI
jgi:hypothetical protein